VVAPQRPEVVGHRAAGDSPDSPPEGVGFEPSVPLAINAGHGLCWGLMGPHLTFHLAGGLGGIDHFLDQFAAPIGELVGDLGPTLTPELRERLAKGIADQTAGRRHRRVGSSKDRFLVDLLALKAGRE
jgi:hypothetical protein